MVSPLHCPEEVLPSFRLKLGLEDVVKISICYFMLHALKFNNQALDYVLSGGKEVILSCLGGRVPYSWLPLLEIVQSIQIDWNPALI
eukprot:m.120878 g.120878  ORF g.120878 m.120878 type:complete len:87 (-) comp9375_c0_seq11:136-396(-)